MILIEKARESTLSKENKKINCWKGHMSILAYMIKFEKVYFTFDMNILEGVLRYRLLNSANITFE